MARAPEHVASDPLAAGWSRLGDGQWSAAKTAFVDALAGGETAEAFEGLSWAAWWLDDADGRRGGRRSRSSETPRPGAQRR